MTNLYSQGKVTITRREGDIYFGRVLLNLPPLPRVYLRFMPVDYESQIPDEERTVEFLSIGGPFDRNYLRLDGNLGRVLEFLLSNIGRPFEKKDLEDALSVGELYSALPDLSCRIESKSRCFRLSKETEERRAIYTLDQVESSREYLERLEELDRELGINKIPKDSLDSAKL